MSTSYNNVQNQGSENKLARGQALFQRFHKATQLYIKQKRNGRIQTLLLESVKLGCSNYIVLCVKFAIVMRQTT